MEVLVLGWHFPTIRRQCLCEGYSGMTDRKSDHLRNSFNGAADLYDRARPYYPDALLDDLLRISKLGPDRSVLEIGPGTGQLTVPLAKSGAKILAVELGQNLAAVARERLSGFGETEVVVADFDSWTPPPLEFDLVVSATAFHWLDPDTRLAKCISLLRPGGTLAVVETHWGAGAGYDRFPVESQRCYSHWRPDCSSDYDPESRRWLPQSKEEFDRDEQLGEASLMRYEVEREYSARQYCELLATYSDVIVLEDAARSGFLRCISELIEARFGGRITGSDVLSLWTTQRMA